MANSAENNSYFNYLNNRRNTGGEVNSYTGSLPGQEVTKPKTPLEELFGGGKEEKGKQKSKAFGKLVGKLRRLGDLPVKEIQKQEEQITKSAPDYAQFLSGQVSRGELSPIEASDRFVDFGLTYNIPDAFKVAGQLGSMQAGMAPSAAVEKYRPFQQFAARTLGISLTPEQIKDTEMAALSTGATSPDAFKALVGSAMMSSPEYIRKNPLAFAANLPEGGFYGVPYQSGGTFTGTYRFKPPSTVNYG